VFITLVQFSSACERVFIYRRSSRSWATLTSSCILAAHHVVSAMTRWIVVSENGTDKRLKWFGKEKHRRRPILYLSPVQVPVRVGGSGPWANASVLAGGISSGSAVFVRRAGSGVTVVLGARGQKQQSVFPIWWWAPMPPPLGAHGARN